MSEKLANKSCVEFAELLASSAPVPGGGGVAALVGALGSSLCSMVGNLTTGKKKYAEVEEDIQRMLAGAEKNRIELLELIDKDAEAFAPLQKAYSIPKDDPNKKKIMQEVSINACQAPLQMMKCICETIDLLEEMRTKGNKGLISDVGCGALCAKAALECAAMNIFINTKSLPDEVVEDLEKEVAAMLDQYLPKAESTAKLVIQKIEG